jgi:hypothetical protein
VTIVSDHVLDAADAVLGGLRRAEADGSVPSPHPSTRVVDKDAPRSDHEPGPPVSPEIDVFLREPNPAVIATLSPDGAPSR